MFADTVRPRPDLARGSNGSRLPDYAAVVLTLLDQVVIVLDVRVHFGSQFYKVDHGFFS